MHLKIIYPKGEEFAPSNVSVSAARTCYFPNGLVEPAKSEGWAPKEGLLSSIFSAGHHTTLQHTHFTILINGISRHLIWRLLHSHPYYNSEQVSQRYAKMRVENFVYPKNGDMGVWQDYYARLFNSYEALVEGLKIEFERILPKFRKKDAIKKAQEFARYILPQGMGAYLYHTINLSVALRYIAAAKTLPEALDEGIEFAELLSKELIDIDPSLSPMIEYAKNAGGGFCDFDMRELKNQKGVKEGECIKIFDVVEPLEHQINENYSDILRLSTLCVDGASMGGFSSYMKLSLSADAQNQRHRRSLAIRPSLQTIYRQESYTPPIIAKNPKLKEIYDKAVKDSYSFFEEQKEIIGFKEAVYALLNAHMIEIVERNDFAVFNHKAQMRLCFNAQEEIYDLVYAQAKILREYGVEGSKKLLPPCSLRKEANISPICPEGDRYCGIKVWKIPFEELKRGY